ncbi:MAG: hypothetical protein ACOCYV_02805 [Planctomycetota bacterium]
MLPLVVGVALVGACVAAALTGEPMWIVPALVGVLFVSPLCMCARRCPHCGRMILDGEDGDCSGCGGTRRHLTED